MCGVSSVRLTTPGYKNQLCDDIYSLWTDNTMLDVKLLCAGHTLEAHKLILSAGSDFFKHRLCNVSMLDLSELGVKIDVAVIKSVLEFIYRGEVDVSQEKLLSVQIIAKALGINKLVSCLNSLKGTFLEQHVDILGTDASHLGLAFNPRPREYPHEGNVRITPSDIALTQFNDVTDGDHIDEELNELTDTIAKQLETEEGMSAFDFKSQNRLLALSPIFETDSTHELQDTLSSKTAYSETTVAAVQTSTDTVPSDMFPHEDSDKVTGEISIQTDIEMEDMDTAFDKYAKNESAPSNNSEHSADEAMFDEDSQSEEQTSANSSLTESPYKRTSTSPVTTQYNDVNTSTSELAIPSVGEYSTLGSVYPGTAVAASRPFSFSNSSTSAFKPVISSSSGYNAMNSTPNDYNTVIITTDCLYSTVDDTVVRRTADEPLLNSVERNSRPVEGKVKQPIALPAPSRESSTYNSEQLQLVTPQVIVATRPVEEPVETSPAKPTRVTCNICGVMLHNSPEAISQHELSHALVDNTPESEDLEPEMVLAPLEGQSRTAPRKRGAGVALGKITLGSVKETSRQCKRCGDFFMSNEALRMHNWKKHKLGTVHRCGVCNHCTPILSSYNKHMLTHVSKAEQAYSCSTCEKTFKSRGGYNAHMKGHAGEVYKSKCSKCDYKTLIKANLSKHMANFHGTDLQGNVLKAGWSCMECSFVCIAEHILKRHVLRKHSNNKAHRCVDCDYSTVEKAALVKHIRIKHTGERPYMCEICGFSSHTNSGMVRHSRTHSGVKPYSCDICSKEYADKKRLTDHLLKHDNVKPFQCDQCGKSYRRQDNLKTHKKKSHGIHKATPNKPPVKLPPAALKLEAKTVDTHTKPDNKTLAYVSNVTVTEPMLDKELEPCDDNETETFVINLEPVPEKISEERNAVSVLNAELMPKTGVSYTYYMPVSAPGLTNVPLHAPGISTERQTILLAPTTTQAAYTHTNDLISLQVPLPASPHT